MVTMETIQAQVSPELARRLHAHRGELPGILELGLRYLETGIDAKSDTEIVSERERADRVLREAGLLTELGPELRKRAELSTVTLDEVVEFMTSAGGKPLSEIVLEQRQAKER